MTTKKMAWGLRVLAVQGGIELVFQQPLLNKLDILQYVLLKLQGTWHLILASLCTQTCALEHLCAYVCTCTHMNKNI